MLDKRLKEILDQERGSKKDPERLVSALNNIVKTALPTKRGFGYGEPKADGQTRTLSARYHKDGAEILYRGVGNGRGA